jgi:hypothetical protein
MAADDLNPRAGKRTIEIPFRWLVRRADPDFDKDRRSEPEYEFGGGRRRFSANRAKRGAYDGTVIPEPEDPMLPPAE